MTEDGEEMVPLHLFCRYYDQHVNKIKLVKDVLSHEAHVNAKANKVEVKNDLPVYSGLNPLYFLFIIFANAELLDLMKLLIENGVKIN